MIHETDMPEFLKYIRNITEHRPFTGGGSKSKRGEEIGQPESVSSVKNSSCPVTIPKAILIPDGPIRLVPSLFLLRSLCFVTNSFMYTVQ